MSPMELTFLPFFAYLITLKCACGKLLLYSTDGAVPRENFTYYTLTYNGYIILELSTTEGDADLYISEKLLTPGFEPDRYDLHSATCGKDVVFVPRSFVRPVGVGIYGHSSHDLSYYVLDVFVATVQDRYAADFEDVERRYESSRTPFVVAPAATTTTTTEKQQVKPEKKPNAKLKKVFTKSGLWALLEMFEMIFL